MTDSHTAVMLQEVLLAPSLRKEMPPLFYDRAFVHTPQGIQNYSKYSSALFSLLRADGKDVLDIGCGFGLRLISFGLLGCGSALGMDISEEEVSGFRTLLRKLPGLNIRAEVGDFLLANQPPASFDIVMVEEAISHVRDTGLLLAKIHEVLRPGGTLYISDGNNDLFLPSLIHSRLEWRRSERGALSKRMREHGRQVDKTGGFEARIIIIKKAFPTLDEKTVRLIARRTQGMWGQEILDAAKEYLETGRIAKKAPFRWRNPYTGEFPELGFNPFLLLKVLQHRGFQCRFVPSPSAFVPILSLPPVRRLSHRLLSRLRKLAPPFLLPFISPSFHILATKLT